MCNQCNDSARDIWIASSIDIYDGVDNYCMQPFYLHGLTLIPEWISNYINHKVWDKVTYPFPNGATLEVIHPALYRACDYLSMRGLKLIYVIKN